MSTALINYEMPPLPVNANQNVWSFKPLEQKWTEYEKEFFEQQSFMERKIGCTIPVESHRLLLKAVVLPEKTSKGIYLGTNPKIDGVNYDIGLVIGIGPEAFKDRRKFPYGPRCKVGDWVDFSPFEKQKKMYNGYLCFVLDDDRVNYPIPLKDIPKIVPEFKEYSLQQIEDLHDRIDITIENNNQ